MTFSARCARARKRQAIIKPSEDTVSLNEMNHVFLSDVADNIDDVPK